MKSQCSGNRPDDSAARAELKKVLEQRIKEYQDHQKMLINQCDKKLARIIEQSCERGSSNWLSSLPLKKYGFTMNKSEFRDSLRLRYGRDPARLPPKCPCGAAFDVNHAVNCPRGGFIIIRHNEVRDFLANQINTVCNHCQIEPPLQEVDGEQFKKKSTLSGELACPDIRARGFYRPGQHAFFDVKVINPNADSYMNIPMKKVYENAENQKKNAYNERIVNIEHGSFIPLIFTVTGGMGPQARTFFRLLCNKISYKNRQEYNDVSSFLKCKLSFLIRKVVLLCLRGSRTVGTKNIVNNYDDYSYCRFESKL